jgi:hypothetical protein
VGLEEAAVPVVVDQSSLSWTRQVEAVRWIEVHETLVVIGQQKYHGIFEMFHGGTGTLAECLRAAFVVASAEVDVVAAVGGLVVVVGLAVVEALAVVEVLVEVDHTAADLAEDSVVEVVVVVLAAAVVAWLFDQDASVAVVHGCLVLYLVEAAVLLLDQDPAMDAAFALVIVDIQVSDAADLATALVQVHTAGVRMDFASAHCEREMGVEGSCFDPEVEK